MNITKQRLKELIKSAATANVSSMLRSGNETIVIEGLAVAAYRRALHYMSPKEAFNGTVKLMNAHPIKVVLK